MTELDDIATLLDSGAARSPIELRDALRAKGRASITTADVVRTLTSNPGRFVVDFEGAPPVGSDGSHAVALLQWRATSADQPGVVGALIPVAVPNWHGPTLFAWQREALAAWRARRRRGVVEAVTGTGKTMVGVAAAAEELGRGGQVCVLVPSRDLLYQWQSVLRSVLMSHVKIGLVGDGHRDEPGSGDDVTIAVVNSAREHDLRPRRPGGLMVADECHRYGSDGNRVALCTSFPYRLGLSATYDRSDGAHLDWLDPYFGRRCFRMGYRRALAERVVAPFDISLVSVEFSDPEMTAYRDLGAAMSKARAILLRSGLVRPEPMGRFLGDVARVASGGGEAAATAMRYLAAMAERRRLLAETPAKAAALAAMTPALAGSTRAIVFTRSIAAAEAAADELRAHGLRAAAVHSLLPRTVRRTTLASFATGDVRIVTAPTVLDEGIDVPAADLAVVLASSQSQRQMVQRMGRVLRYKPDGRAARFVIVFVRGTAEDPALGAHEGFLDEIMPLAREVHRSC